MQLTQQRILGKKEEEKKIKNRTYRSHDWLIWIEITIDRDGRENLGKEKKISER